MPVIYSRFISKLLGLSRLSKNLLIMVTDYTILTLCFWASLSIRINSVYWPTTELEGIGAKFLILLAPFIAIPIFYLFGLYRSMVRYSGYQNLLTIMLGVSVYTLVWFLVVKFSGLVEKPYDFLIINWLLTTFLVGGIRILIRWLLIAENPTSSNIVIYGAGSAGVQLVSAMKYNPDMKAVAFLDDDVLVQGLYIEGLKVYKPSVLNWLIEKKEVSEVLVALPSLSRAETQVLLQSLKQYPIVIRALPDLSDLAQGRVSVSDLKQIKIEDLLRRAVRKPDEKLLKKDVEQKNILITGAGGSIGSELSRQIIKQNPRLLVLFDISEFALYSLDLELSDMNSNVRVISVLGDVTKGSRLKKIFEVFDIQTVYHAAAYKHVPMVEKNSIAGVRVNVFGTLACLQTAIDTGVESFVFISTDKAVRPTNMMGATKRFAELILQARAKLKSKKTTQEKIRINIVRFGNVLGSSGSVAPLFEEQIKKGGPVTVTDPSIIRYFMTISEAAQLVIQAGSLGSKGEIFILNMGKQMRIKQLAEDMIRLSGQTVRDENNPNGDIEIIYTGLRPGEKLYEELLIGDNVNTTEHEKIMKATEEYLDWEDIQKYLVELKHASEMDNYEKIRKIFLETVSGFNPDNEIVDSLYIEHTNNIARES